MTDLTKGAFFFGAGLILGYLGARAIDDPAGKVRGAAVGVISQGMDFKERLMTSVERARENVEDMVAEAKHHGQKDQSRPVPDDKNK